jgi:hypothetical protein
MLPSQQHRIPKCRLHFLFPKLHTSPQSYSPQQSWSATGHSPRQSNASGCRPSGVKHCRQAAQDWPCIRQALVLASRSGSWLRRKLTEPLKCPHGSWPKILPPHDISTILPCHGCSPESPRGKPNARKMVYMSWSCLFKF